MVQPFQCKRWNATEPEVTCEMLKDVPCAHKGAETRQVDCGCASQNNKVPVYECGVYGECLEAWSKTAKRLKLGSCDGCKEHWSPELIRRVQPLTEPPAKPPRVAFYVPRLYTGGIEEWLIQLASHMPAEIAKFACVVADNPVIDTEQGRRLNAIVPVVAADCIPDVDAIVTTYASKPDQWRGIPIKVLVSHGVVDGCRQLAQDHAPFCTHLVAVSEGAATNYRGMRRPVTVIDNGAGRVPLSREPGQLVRITEEFPRPWIGAVTRWSDEKRPLAAIMAAQALGGTAVYIVPDSQRQNAEARLQQAGHVRYVVLDQSQVGLLYSAVDAIVCCSQSEGGPIVPMEAMRAGCPLIATDVGSLPDLQRRFGKLYESVPHDPSSLQIEGEEIAAAFHRIDPQTVQRAEKIGREYLSADRMATEWANFLATITIAAQ